MTEQIMTNFRRGYRAFKDGRPYDQEAGLMWRLGFETAHMNQLEAEEKAEDEARWKANGRDVGTPSESTIIRFLPRIPRQ